jgi:hypothetical protein
MKKSKSAGRKLKKKASRASNTARKAIEKGSRSLKMNLVRGAAALRREVEEKTPAVKKAVESGVGKVVHMTGEAARLGRLKVEMAALNIEKEKLLQQLGGEVWHLYQQKRLDAVQQDLGEVFGNLEKLSGRIAAKESEIKGVSFS